jgi:hypothetical protein
VKGILADANSVGHVRLLLQLFQSEGRREFWEFLNLAAPGFADLGLLPTYSDQAVWLRCQQERLILITINRNEEGPDSLEATLQTLNEATSLPVVTIADAHRLLNERSYAERAADKLLEYLFDMDQYLGAGRLYIP